MGQRESVNKPDLLKLTGTPRLHIGGTQAREGWDILNIQKTDCTDYVGDICDLSQFLDDHFDAVYASHVLEHVSYQNELLRAVKGIHRILKPQGKFLVGVPDFELLCRLFVDKKLTMQDRFSIMRIMFGGQMDAHDFHHVGLTEEFLADLLSVAGFREIYRVPEFNIFNDTSSTKFGDVLISLNMVAIK
jgi:predicted SAM-dependent methyltransferase